MSKKKKHYLRITPTDNSRLNRLCGPLNTHLHLIERHLGVEINHRGNEFEIIGPSALLSQATQILQTLYQKTQHSLIAHMDLLSLLKPTTSDPSLTKPTLKQQTKPSTLSLRFTQIQSRTVNQQHYLKAIENHDVNFGIGPSGTGKTFLAIASAVAALEKEHIHRIVLVRPAVSAGESLGFLPGDLAQKVDPYLRPLYDALNETMNPSQMNRLIEKNQIEIVPLAYMRGRTLNDAFIILDEGQNTTVDQMRMFLTRIGFRSKAVITGDITQVDLPKHTLSGLRHAMTLLHEIDGIHVTFFTVNDIVRHPLVQRIIEAYEAQDPPNEH